MVLKFIIMPQIYIKYKISSIMYKLRSKLGFLFKNLFVQNFKFKHSNSSMIYKLTLASASMFFLPKYIYLAASQNTTQQTQTNQPTQAQQPNNKPTQQSQQQYQQNHIINFITDYQDAQKLNLKGHTLIWYQMTGQEHIDEEVIIMLRKFVNDRYHSISSPFKIIIDKTPRSSQINKSNNYYKKPVQIVIIKPQNLKPINLSRYLSYQRTSDFKYHTLFERLTHQINQFQQINSTNIHQFADSLGNRSYQACVVMNAPHDRAKIRRAKKNFKNFIDDKSVFAAHVNKIIVTDQFASKYLGLPQYKPQGDNIYVIVPQTENVVKQGASSTIHSNKYYIYPSNQVNQSLVIPPYLQKSSPDSLFMKIHVDLNQNVASHLSTLYETLKQSDSHPQLSSIPKLIIFNSIKQKNNKGIQISVEKNNFDQIVNVYSPQCRYSNKEKKQLIYQGNKWKFQEESIQAQALQEWLGNVIHHKIKPTFDSQNLETGKVKKYNSTRITGEQYYNVVHGNRKKPKVVLHYSQHCHSCKKFSPVFQQIAGEKQQKYEFYRIDNDFNRTKGLRNFNSTPVFAFYKNGHIYTYKNNIFTKRLFEDFLEITNSLKTMNLEDIEKCVNDRKQNQFSMKDLL